VSTPPETTYSAPPVYSSAAGASGSDLPAIPPSSATPENPPWGVTAAILTWLTSIALLFLAPNVFVLPYLLSHYRGLPAPTEQVLLADKTFVLLFVIGWLPAHLLTLMLIWAVATKRGKFSFTKVLGFSWPPGFGVLKSVGLAISLFLAALFITAWFGAQPTDLDRLLTSSRAAALMLALIAVATAPLVEELTYRGLLYSALQRALGPWFAVVVVSSMFAGLHVWQYRQNLGAITSITLLSVVLTVIRARTGRLLPCFVVHLVFNGVQSLIIVLEPYLRALFEHWRPHPTTGALIYLLRSLY
jgi:membrane protease YdiL (CAAX protease family)